MGRVSLTEDYDDRSVISKLNEMDKRVKENTTVVTAAEASAKASAQAAQETADRFAGSVGAVVQNANQQINASKAQVDQAKAEVDETVTTVAQAVQTANNASASAQQSATTVAGYDTRLTAVEDADTKNVKLDTNQVITGHKKFVQISTTGVPLEAERKGNGAGVSITQTDQKMTDAGVQYYSGMYIYDGNGNRVGGWYPVKETDSRTTLRMRINNAAGETNELVVDGDFVLSNSMVSKRYVESTDGVTNNLVHRTTNETLDGIKSFKCAVIVDRGIPPLDQTPSAQVANDILAVTTQGSNYPIFSNIHVYREPSGTNELSIDLCPTGWDGSFSKRVRLRITVDSNGVGHLVFYNGQRSVELA